MITKTTKAALGLAGLGVLAGCTETLDSQQIRTGGISATLEAVAESASSTSVTATLKAGGDESNTYVILSGGDRISAEADGETVDMSAESAGVYVARFKTGAEDTEFKVLLDREDDDDAPGNAGTLPAPFDLEALPSEPASRGEDLTVAWSPSGTGDDMQIRVNGSCIFSRTIDVGGDPGTYTIKAGTLESTREDEPETCDVDIVISRARSGVTDPGLDPESSFELKQVRRDRFPSAP
ncbi:hypothetical protein SOCEGT47_055330 [Sorangium cellulosum]|jgi:hypothetical protein|uniref:Secreted protein n=1 Tax=Sorangium cellulosum TaxID=56 RepID=A0A4V0NE55_SORCE|nr:hypothetical protein [Sorangium cellulosum]AUX24992.1 hypothetical protein SOCEGT47_055330 [Sorangium cellulosum]